MSIHHANRGAAILIAAAILVVTSWECPVSLPDFSGHGEPVANPADQSGPGVTGHNEGSVDPHILKGQPADSDDQLPPGNLEPGGDLGQPVAPNPQPAPESHAPHIDVIQVPAQIPTTGERVNASIRFSDAAQDVNLVKADVVQATHDAYPFSFDPTGSITWSMGYGIIPFYLWCTGDPQMVTWSFTLQDAAGNTSQPYQVGYVCK
jgi:hypothetical protein